MAACSSTPAYRRAGPWRAAQCVLAAAVLAAAPRALARGWMALVRLVRLLRGRGVPAPEARPPRPPADALRLQRHLDALLQVILASAHTMDPEQTARSALDAIVRILGAERAFLFWCTEVSGTLTLRAARDVSGADVPAAPPESLPVVERVQAEQRPLVFDVPQAPRSILAAPLHIAERLTGVVYVEGPLAGGASALEDLAILQAIANHVAVAIETARVAHLEVHVAAEREQRRLAETLAAVVATLTATLDLDEVLNRLLENLALVVPYDSATVLLRDGEHFRVGAARGHADAVATRRLIVPAGNDLLREVLETRWPVTLADVRGDRRYRGYGGADYTRAWMGLPLLIGDEVIGFLTLDNHEPGVYGEPEALIAFTFAGQAAVAIRNARLFGEARRLASTDSLTRVHNRHQFFELAEAEFSAARLYSRPLAAIMLDIDHFKRVNDSYGHAAGDDVLRVVAERCRAVLRDTDILGRYGGEEFVALLPHTEERAAALVAERLRALVADAPIGFDGGALNLTISVGVATLDTETRNLEALLGSADAALYEAKQAGRNRVAIG
jgi:diguanylate cyclase (GGDEF)-like protein